MIKNAIFIFLVFLSSAACAPPRPAGVPRPAAVPLPEGSLLKELPSVFPAGRGWSYKVDPYIAAAKLQAADRDEAVESLRTAAKDADAAAKHAVQYPHQSSDKVILLCRMLFTAKPNGEFRRPMIGAPLCLGDTDLKDWPLEPIEIVDGIPFLVVRGYQGSGVPEPAEHYLSYCLQECDWAADRFQPKAAGEKKKALDKLLTSRKWKRPLTEYEEGFLLSQVQ
jgi:hypothetical protein